MTLSLSVPGASDSPVWMTDVSIVSVSVTVSVGVCICVFVSVSTLIDVCGSVPAPACRLPLLLATKSKAHYSIDSLIFAPAAIGDRRLRNVMP